MTYLITNPDTFKGKLLDCENDFNGRTAFANAALRVTFDSKSFNTIGS